MIEKVETLYQKIKSDLQTKDNVQLFGELVDYPDDPYYGCLTERVSFVIAPKSKIEFESEQLWGFMRTLKLADKNAFIAYPAWSEVQLADGSNISVFTFGIIKYSEPLPAYGNLLNPVSCLEYLGRRGKAPNLNRFHSRRDLYVHVYPLWRYANQVYVYKSEATGYKTENPNMEFLTRSVTREQLAFIQEQGAYAVLRDIPPHPDFFSDFTGR